MKKILQLFIPCLLILCFLCSCFSLSDGPTREATPTGTSGDPTPTGTSENTTPTDAPDTPTPTAKEKELSIEETVCFSWEGLSVTAKSIGTDSFWKTTEMKLLIENGTDTAYCVGCQALIVNNCMISDLFSCEVAAGKKANDSMTFSSTGLETAGITRIGLIEIYFYVYDAESWETVYEAPATVIRTSLYDEMDGNGCTDGSLLYDKGGVKIYGLELKEDPIWGKEVLFCVENTTDQIVHVSADDISVNGFMLGGYLSATVYPGKYCIDDISFSDDELEENDIENIEEMELSFRIYGDDSLFPIDKTDPITFTLR